MTEQDRRIADVLSAYEDTLYADPVTTQPGARSDAAAALRAVANHRNRRLLWRRACGYGMQQLAEHHRLGTNSVRRIIDTCISHIRKELRISTINSGGY
jgi:hypothetical protein